MGGRGKVWRACASAWAQVPPNAVSVGDRVPEDVLRKALEDVLRTLGPSASQPHNAEPLADWLSAAFASVKDRDGLVTYDDFVDLAEQYTDSAALSGTAAPVHVNATSPAAPQMNAVSRTLEEQQDTAKNKGTSGSKDKEETFDEKLLRLCKQAFFWVDPEGMEAVNVSQAKTALAMVFMRIQVPNPPDEWHNLAFANFDRDRTGLIEFPDLHEIAIQHCALDHSTRAESRMEPPSPRVQASCQTGNSLSCQTGNSLVETITQKPRYCRASSPGAWSLDYSSMGSPLCQSGCSPLDVASGGGAKATTAGRRTEDVVSHALELTGLKDKETPSSNVMLTKDQCKKALTESAALVAGSTLPPDEWCEKAFENFDEERRGHVTAEDAAEILEEWLKIQPKAPAPKAEQPADASKSGPSEPQQPVPVSSPSPVSARKSPVSDAASRAAAAAAKAKALVEAAGGKVTAVALPASAFMRSMPQSRRIASAPSPTKASADVKEDEIYSKFSKLYFFVGNDWEDRGTGEAKLLKHKKTGQVRFMLLQEKTMKVLCNHVVVDVPPYCKLVPHAHGDRCWVWIVQNFVGDEMKVEKVALKFGTSEQANDFKNAFDKAKLLSKKASPSETEGVSEPAPAVAISVTRASKVEAEAKRRKEEAAAAKAAEAAKIAEEQRLKLESDAAELARKEAELARREAELAESAELARKQAEEAAAKANEERRLLELRRASEERRQAAEKARLAEEERLRAEEHARKEAQAFKEQRKLLEEERRAEEEEERKRLEEEARKRAEEQQRRRAEEEERRRRAEEEERRKRADEDERRRRAEEEQRRKHAEEEERRRRAEEENKKQSQAMAAAGRKTVRIGQAHVQQISAMNESPENSHAPCTPGTSGTPGTRCTNVRSASSVQSNVSSCKSEVFDIYGSVRSRADSGRSRADSGRSRADSAASNAPVPRSRKSRKSVVPVAAQVMTPAYSGQLRVFDDYEFMEEKGSGAFGRVMRVQHKRTGLQRCCKAVSIRSPRQFELVETEVALMRKLDHPNVLRLFESYYDGDRNIYLVIELCQGGSLTDRLKSYSPNLMPEVPSSWALSDMLTALQYCHKKGVIHRDIKPDNLLYLGKSEDSLLKVIDFGLSDFLAKIERRATIEQGSKRKNKTAARIGTPHYMAAEVYLESIYDEKVDAFACGVVLAEMLTGVHPFFELGKDNLESIRAKILRGKVDFNAVHWQRVAPPAKQLCKQLLNPDRRQRADASAALAHPWIKRGKSLHTGAQLQRSVFEALSRFRNFNVLKQAAFRVIAKLLDDTQLASLQRQFQLLDVDGDGMISGLELVEGARRCNVDLTQADVEDILDSFGRVMNLGQPGATFSDPSVGYSDFLASLLECGVTLHQAQLREVFSRFTNGSQVITWQSLQATLTAMAGQTPQILNGAPQSGIGEDVTEEELRQVFAELGVSNVIDFNAFCHIWRPVARE